MQVMMRIDRQYVGERRHPDRGFGKADRQREAEGDQEKDQQECQRWCNDQPAPVFAGQNVPQEGGFHLMRDYAKAATVLPREVTPPATRRACLVRVRAYR